MSHVIAVVQCRLQSTRLPGKALLDLAGRPLLAHVLERAHAIAGVDEVVLTTPPADAPALLAVWPSVRWVPHWPPDVLAGYQAAVYGTEATHIVRITGDTPLLTTDTAWLTIQTALAGDFDYFATTRPDTTNAPDGLDVEVIDRESLQIAHDKARGVDREHVTSYLYARAGMFHCGQPAVIGPHWLRTMKLSVDTADDLARVRCIAERLPPKDYTMAALLTAAEGCAL